MAYSALIVDNHLRKLLWEYCSVPAGVKENDRADKLAGKVTLASGLFFGRSEVLRSLIISETLTAAQSQGHHTMDHLEERGVERGSARRSSLKGRQRATVSQTHAGTVSKATLRKRLRGGVERIDTVLN